MLFLKKKLSKLTIIIAIFNLHYECTNGRLSNYFDHLVKLQ